MIIKLSKLYSLKINYTYIWYISIFVIYVYVYLHQSEHKLSNVSLKNLLFFKLIILREKEFTFLGQNLRFY